MDALATAERMPEEALDTDSLVGLVPRDPAWNPWLYASGPALQAVVADVIHQSLNAERAIRRFRRKRSRRPADLASFRATVEALVSHVVYEHIRGAGPVRVSLADAKLNRASRYRSPLQTGQLRKVIDLLSTPEMLFLAVEKGAKATPFTPGRQTTIEAGSRLTPLLDGITLDDIGRKPGEELLLLKGTRDSEAGHAELIEYKDTEQTDKFRSEMRKLNAFLADSIIDYTGNNPHVDDRDRFLTRRFTRGCFMSGGRVFGGFWQRMKKADRLANVEINHEPVVSLDFESVILSIAYSHVRRSLPEGDAYAITFTSTDGKPVVLPRPVVKKIIAARLNGAREWPSDLREFRPGLSWRSVIDTLKHAHAPIAPFFDLNCTLDLGQSFMFTESEVLMEALVNLMEDDIVALPIHDCIVVAESDVEAARKALLDSFTFQTGQTARVAIERSKEATHG